MLIRLCECAGWSAPLLFAYGKNGFSHDVAHIHYDWMHILKPTTIYVIIQGFNKCLSVQIERMLCTLQFQRFPNDALAVSCLDVTTWNSFVSVSVYYKNKNNSSQEAVNKQWLVSWVLWPIYQTRILKQSLQNFTKMPCFTWEFQCQHTSLCIIIINNFY